MHKGIYQSIRPSKYLWCHKPSWQRTPWPSMFHILGCNGTCHWAGERPTETPPRTTGMSALSPLAAEGLGQGVEEGLPRALVACCAEAGGALQPNGHPLEWCSLASCLRLVDYPLWSQSPRMWIRKKTVLPYTIVSSSAGNPAHCPIVMLGMAAS